MKQVTYRIVGHVTDDMVPAITLSCDTLRGVTKAKLDIADADNATLVLTLIGEPDPSLFEDVVSIMYAKGLEVREDIHFDGREDGVPMQSFDTDAPPQPKHYVLGDAPRRGRSVPLGAAVASVLTAVILAVLLTFSLTTAYHKQDTPPVAGSVDSDKDEAVYAELEVIDRLFRDLSMKDLDDEALLTAVLKGYVTATGDPYAEYFTAEEFARQTSSMNGEVYGIGVSVVQGEIVSEGNAYTAIIVAYVYPDSPAEAAGVVHGDAIMFVGKGDDKTLVRDIGYAEALDRMSGTAGTECAFTVYRRPQGSDDDVPYEAIDISAVRQKFTAQSVLSHVYEPDPTVGIIRMTGFDNPTAAQFVEAMDALKEQGCTAFVLDLRNNPGGLLTSVEDILIYFLQEGDTLISTKNSKGVTSVTTIGIGENGKVTCGSGSVDQTDLGKYADLPLTVLVNENSASAAELFTANIRDHELGTIVGTTTYGKGSMQTTYSLARYGYDGALKLTTAYYYPPSGEGYDGIGITPHVAVELSEEAQKYNINLLPDELDNQLIAAVEALSD